MKLIGMLDSPYVRRSAISLLLLGVPFEHRSLSVFRTFDEFRRLSPVVKAPSLLCDDGSVLLDSTLIIDYAEAIAAPGRSLMPRAPAARLRALCCLGLALAACEKSVQIVYERNRPAERQHAPWVERVTGQMLAALAGLEAEIERGSIPPPRAGTIDQAGVTTAVVWRFIVAMMPGLVDPKAFPRIAALAAEAERLPSFAAAPHGDAEIAPAVSMPAAG
jgi:glutathione S-transferase